MASRFPFKEEIAGSNPVQSSFRKEAEMLDILFNGPIGGIVLLAIIIACLIFSPILLVGLIGLVIVCWMIHALFGGY